MTADGLPSGPAPKSGPHPPKKLGRYEVLGKIGEGGMATLYAGRLSGGKGGASGTLFMEERRVVALKVIRDEYLRNREFVNMFLDEAKIISRLRHPNIVQLYELGVEGARVFIAMELLKGQSLWHVWEACQDRKIRLRYDMIAWIGARVAEGLHHAHDSKDNQGQDVHIVHRDVNSTNIFVAYDGSVKVIDFGLAHAANRMSKTADGVIKGKVAYMSPEQSIGAGVDRRTDVFALGITLWEMAVDRRLFKDKDELETLRRVHAAEVPDPTRLVDGFPPGLWSILRRALAREPEDRYPTAGELARDLDAFSYSEGRTITKETIAAAMNLLFDDERARQDVWIADASEGGSISKQTMNPPTSFQSTLGAREDEKASLSPPRVPKDVGSFWTDGQGATFSPASKPPSHLPGSAGPSPSRTPSARVEPSIEVIAPPPVAPNAPSGASSPRPANADKTLSSPSSSPPRGVRGVRGVRELPNLDVDDRLAETVSKNRPGLRASSFVALAVGAIVLAVLLGAGCALLFRLAR